jgi:hypothetical protein
VSPEALGKQEGVTDFAPDSPRTISRRPFAYWAALAVLLIFASTTVALYLATYLADLI